MTEEERQLEIEHLVNEVGLDRDDAESRLLDSDLWVIHPATRIPAVGNAEACREAEHTLGDLADFFEARHAETWVALVDARERFGELASRAEERASS
jgi:hypothetical protein